MSLGVKTLNYGSEICREWAASIKRNPLKKNILRCVTIAKDDATRTIGKNADFSFIEIQKPNGFKKVIVKDLSGNNAISEIRYPDGSWSTTCYSGTKPIRTNGEFVITKKNGEIQKLGYSQDGYLAPEYHKELFIKNLYRLGNPKYEVDLREVFGERPKSKILRFLGDIKYKAGKFFERFNKQNTELRKYAKSIDVNA